MLAFQPGLPEQDLEGASGDALTGFEDPLADLTDEVGGAAQRDRRRVLGLSGDGAVDHVARVTWAWDGVSRRLLFSGFVGLNGLTTRVSVSSDRLVV
jgi:hypothetical protein